MKEEDLAKEVARPLRSGSKVQQNMKIPGPPLAKVAKVQSKLEDLSILKKSVDTSVTGPMEIMKILQSGTQEVIDMLKKECFVIYECKVCRNLFRSLANFITHKRNFCTAKFNTSQQSGNDGDALEHSLVVGGVKGTVSSSRKTTRRDILSLLDNLKERLPDAKASGLVFSEIPQTQTAVFNSTNHSSPSTTPTKEEKLESTKVVGPNGKIVGNTHDNGLSMDCKSCGESISHIESHVDLCSAVFKQCFGCPMCDRYFTTSWAVYRHLKKVHGQNTEQVRKLRNSIKKMELPVEKKLKRAFAALSGNNSTNNSEKGWLDELQKNVDGPYECYLCKKPFERRAALLTHTKECEKRKPGTCEQDKKLSQSSSSSPSPSPTPEKSLASIQMVVCYKKDLASKLNNCRVVATRLSDEETIAALLPPKENFMQDSANQSAENSTSPEDRQDLNLLGIEESSNFVNDSNANNGQHENHNEYLEDEMEIDETELKSNVDLADNPSQDMFASQLSNCEGISNYDNVGTNIENDKVTETVVTNGFCSSPSVSSKDPTSPEVCPSQDICNGWESPIKNVDKNKFFSSFSDKNDGDNTSDSQNCINLDDINSADVKRIICGSVKPDRAPSLDEDTLDKPTPSVSTDVSIDFEGSEPYEDTDDLNEFQYSLESYISKSDSVCMICFETITDMRYGYSHVAYHLGITRYACLVPNCTAQAFAKSDLIDHISLTHGLDCSASLIKTLDQDEMYTDEVPNFSGFVLPDDIDSVHNEFFTSLANRHGISSPHK